MAKKKESKQEKEQVSEPRRLTDQKDEEEQAALERAKPEGAEKPEEK